MLDSNLKFVELAFSVTIVKRALKTSLLVGTILALINHGADIISLSVTGESFIKIVVTYGVPYCVSTYSSVRAMQAYARGWK